MLIFFLRSVKFAVQGFIRNFWLSIVTIVILVLTLFSVTIVAGINFVGDKAITSVKDKIDVSVYFQPDAPESAVLQVRDSLAALSQVKSVEYVSKEQALADFQERHGDDPVILESIEELELNPLNATLVVTADQLDDYNAILAVLDTPGYAELIQERNFDDNAEVIQRLSDISGQLERIGLAISIIFLLIAFLIIFNTIRINIYTHREEIGIMKLVGASNWFARAPFLIESLLYGVIAVVVSMAILYPLVSVVAPELNTFFVGYDIDLIGYVNSHLLSIALLQVLLCGVLCVLSSSVAITRYLKV